MSSTEQSNQVALVVLEGIKVCTEKTALTPLWRVIRELTNPKDEILVLTILYAGSSILDSRTSEKEGEDIEFLHQEIRRRKDIYEKIFRPFYDVCRSKGVKFQVKIAAGFRPKDIIVEEANSAKATWIVMDRCFARDMTLRLSGTVCVVSLADEYDDNGSESSMLMEVIESLNLPKKPNSQQNSYSLTSTSKNSGKQTIYKENLSFEENGLEGQPVELSWEMIMKITGGFSNPKNPKNALLVKKLVPSSSNILEAEKKAAMFMYHKNIMVIKGYHQIQNGAFVVFPHFPNGTLHKYLSEYGRKELALTFQEKLKIAIGVAQGIRYMHTECPLGPVIHTDLQPRNIFLTTDLQPKIFGFGRATWLNYQQASLICKDRSLVKGHLSHESIIMMTRDVLSFGILLLRLFCRKSAPLDDKSLVGWARPLLLQGKFDEVLDEDLGTSDLHGILRVMTAATKCMRSVPSSRHCITEVLCILKGEKLCVYSKQSTEANDGLRI